MGKKPFKRLAGFVSLNEGTIENCYSMASVYARRETAGLCYENRASIRNSYVRARIVARGGRAGLILKQNGDVEGSFWIYDAELEKEKEKEWEDLDLAQAENEDLYTLAQSYGWDVNRIWSFAENFPKLYTQHNETVPFGEEVAITTPEELYALVQRVNEGDSMKGVLVSLKNDINLGGKPWTPIGLDMESPFCGTFNGNGYGIRDFRVNAKKYQRAGFFGCIGEGGYICNLDVDCVVLRPGQYSALFCAENKGLIESCVANGHVHGGRMSACFVAKNSGTIRASYASGRVFEPISPFPWWVLLLILLSLQLATVGGFVLASAPEGREIFAPIIADPNAELMEVGPEIMPAPEEEERETSASFVMNAEMAVSAKNYVGNINLRCPSWSTQNITLTLRVSAEELRKNGYASSAANVTLYESGLIRVGYGMDRITLGRLPGGKGLPVGTYEVMGEINFYDAVTNEKAAINSVAPITVTVLA